MEKHAYLIITHKVDRVLLTLLSQIDDFRNDIFIHVDKKAKTFDTDAVKSKIKKSNLFFTKRIRINWGGYSQIKAELILLETATKTDHYGYYHLLSGSDLLIKSQDYIHSYFAQCGKTEFIGFETKNDYSYRIRYHYYLQDFLKRGSKKKFDRILFKIQLVMIKIQRKIKINRIKNLKVYKGCNWFSISDSLARYVLSQKTFIRHYFKHSFCADELFLQTVVKNSECCWKTNDKGDSSPEKALRLIDWNRGNPYVFSIEDYEEIKDSKMIFARKFSAESDEKIIDSVFKMTNNYEV